MRDVRTLRITPLGRVKTLHIPQNIQAPWNDGATGMTCMETFFDVEMEERDLVRHVRASVGTRRSRRPSFCSPHLNGRLCSAVSARRSQTQISRSLSFRLSPSRNTAIRIWAAKWIIWTGPETTRRRRRVGEPRGTSCVSFQN